MSPGGNRAFPIPRPAFPPGVASRKGGTPSRSLRKEYSPSCDPVPRGERPVPHGERDRRAGECSGQGPSVPFPRAFGAFPLGNDSFPTGNGIEETGNALDKLLRFHSPELSRHSPWGTGHSLRGMGSERQGMPFDEVLRFHSPELARHSPWGMAFEEGGARRRFPPRSSADGIVRVENPPERVRQPGVVRWRKLALGDDLGDLLEALLGGLVEI